MEEGLRSHAICLCEVFLLVTVDLGKCDLVRAGQLSRQRVVDWGDGFAWSAPVGVDCSDRVSQLLLRFVLNGSG